MQQSLRRLGLLSLLLIALAACGSGTIQTGPGSFATATTVLNAFSLGSDFPPDVQIPDIAGMDSTAFVVTFTPAAVVPVDLNSTPLKVSEQFKVLDLSTLPAAAFPNRLRLLSPTQGLLLAGAALIYFNPGTGAILGQTDLGAALDLTETLAYSRPGDCDFDGSPESSVGPGTFSPSFAADLAVLGGKVFVTMSNSCFDPDFSSFYVQGLVRIFDLHEAEPFLTPAAKPYLALSGFNATGLTVANGKLIATSSGDTELVGNASLPETPSFLDEIDPQTLQITRSLNLGKVAANFRAMAVTEDGAEGFLGSSAFSEVYEINLRNFSVQRGIDNPISVSALEQDYISDQTIPFGGKLLFVSSFNQSQVFAIDLADPNLPVLEQSLNFAFSENPGVTGAGPMAVRPGEPGVDFSGPDLFVLTNAPGTISTAKTY
ncbi:MAG TPA: hypothetical protein DF383_02765 [Deltaproteobacteria bacterium]|nr:hypothetical protein [Deltaproteobacteria bacterium]